MAGRRLVPGKTLVFFDEVQVCPEAVTYVKFLVEEGCSRYVLSGSLLGVEMKKIRSVPVGYMDEWQMFPLDFGEFVRANGVGDDVIDHLRDCFDNRRSPDPLVHSRMMRYHSLYLVSGGEGRRGPSHRGEERQGFQEPRSPEQSDVGAGVRHPRCMGA